MPLLMCTSSSGVQSPLLQRLADILDEIQLENAGENTQELKRLRQVVLKALQRLVSVFNRPLFVKHVESVPPPAALLEAHETVDMAPLDMPLLCASLHLDNEGVSALEGTMRRLEKVLNAQMDENDGKDERGVREL